MERRRLIATGGWRGAYRMPVRICGNAEFEPSYGRIGGNDTARDRERLQAIRDAIGAGNCGLDEIAIGEG